VTNWLSSIQIAIAHQMNVKLACQLTNVLIDLWKNAVGGNPLTSSLSDIERTKNISFDTYHYRK
jgi:hypothetical protein